ncbi:MAG: threonine ammonia-lyase, biosynthetic, partial [Alkalispirochaeta sp.]
MIDDIRNVLLARVYDVAEETPLTRATKLSMSIGVEVYLKREDLQPVHSFKLRGAYNRLSHLTEEERSRGVIAASAGNHAQGVALGASRLGIAATIVMPKTTPSIKVDAVRGHGATVVLRGDSFNDAYAHARELISETGATFIHPFDDPLVIAGQGTVGREILEQLPDATHIFVPVGGGGLLAGIAMYVKQLRPEIRIIGVEPADSNVMQRSLVEGRRVILDHVGIFADGVAVKQAGEHTFALARKYVDSVITVTTDEICAAIKAVFEDTRSIVEPAGALAAAGAMHTELPTDAHVVAICSGANMTFERLQQVAERTLIGSGREVLVAITMPERAGALRRFCTEI